MKSTGMVRKVDELGRIVIPIEIRRTLGIEEKDPVEIYIDSDRIVLQKYEPNLEKEDVRVKLTSIAAQSNSTLVKDTIERAIKLIK